MKAFLTSQGKPFVPFLIVFCITVGFLSGVQKEGNGLLVKIPRAVEIEEVMLRVNAYQRTHPYTDRHTGEIVKLDRNWIRATYYTGVTAHYLVTKDREILKQLTEWAEKHDWQVGDETYSMANRLTCGQTYLQLYFLNPEQHMIQSTKEWVDSGLPGSPSSEEIWYFEGGRMWCDSLYTAPPTLVMLAKATGERKYLDYMNKMYWDVYENLFDQEAGLFYRDERFIGQRTEAGKKVLWSRGNGWVIAGLARILTYLPKEDAEYERFLQLYLRMAKAVARAQSEDGLWRSNLADPMQFANPESSGSAFFCYALAWGINNGVLPAANYLPTVSRAWKGLLTCVHESGKLGWVQPVGAGPESTTFDSTHEYGTGAFLLAGSEMIKLARSLREH
jgi:rhamnogalacturonyl hydrolase YesR